MSLVSEWVHIHLLCAMYFDANTNLLTSFLGLLYIDKGVILHLVQNSISTREKEKTKNERENK